MIKLTFSCFFSDILKKTSPCPIVEHYIVFLFPDCMDHIEKKPHLHGDSDS